MQVIQHTQQATPNKCSKSEMKVKMGSMDIKQKDTQDHDTYIKITENMGLPPWNGQWRMQDKTLEYETL